MTKTKILALFAIVAVAAMMGTASITPAYAAQKVADRSSKETISDNGLLCGELVQIDGFFLSRFIQWDNDKFVLHFNFNVVLTDASGKGVGTWSGVFYQQGDSGDLPVSFQSNSKVTCKNAPNSISNFGAILHKDGSVTFHG